MLLPCILAQSMVYDRVAIDVPRPCFCSLTHRHACVCQCVCACANACAWAYVLALARAHTADVLADFCDGDVAPRSRKRSRRLPHAHLPPTPLFPSFTHPKLPLESSLSLTLYFFIHPVTQTSTPDAQQSGTSLRPSRRFIGERVER